MDLFNEIDSWYVYISWIGGLLGDVFLHLLPHAFLGEHTEENAVVVIDNKKNVLIGTGIFVGLFFFFFMDKMMRVINGGSGHDHHTHESSSVGHSTAVESTQLTQRKKKEKEEDVKEEKKKQKYQRCPLSEPSLFLAISDSAKIKNIQIALHPWKVFFFFFSFLLSETVYLGCRRYQKKAERVLEISK